MILMLRMYASIFLEIHSILLFQMINAMLYGCHILSLYPIQVLSNIVSIAVLDGIGK
eukprot:c53397_g1_i1 orf=101-271(+)